MSPTPFKMEQRQRNNQYLRRLLAKATPEVRRAYWSQVRKARNKLERVHQRWEKAEAEEQRKRDLAVANFRRNLRRCQREVRRGPPPVLAPEDQPQPGSYAATQDDAAEWLAVNRLMVEYGYISAATAEEHKAYMFKAH